jgi:hypothetical protein
MNLAPLLNPKLQEPREFKAPIIPHKKSTNKSTDKKKLTKKH